MQFPWTVTHRIAGLTIVAGMVATALSAQSAAVGLRPASATDTVAAVSVELPTTPSTAQLLPVVTSTANACEAQHWPYYSSECLRGEGPALAARQVKLQQDPSAMPAPAPAAVAPVAIAERKTIEPSQASETPRRPKVRQTPRYASRPVQRVRLMQPERAIPEQALAFSW